MWKPQLHNVDIDPVTRAAGAALLCSILSQRLSSRQTELGSEIVAWYVLPVAFSFARRPPVNKLPRTVTFSIPETRPASAASLWVVALSVATFCLFKAENGMVEFFPALTPLLLVAQNYRGPELCISARTDASLFSPFANTVWGNALVATFTIITLFDRDTLGCVLSAVPVAALLIAYITLTPRAGRGSRYVPPFDNEIGILPLSARVVIILVISLGVEVIVFGFPTGLSIATLPVGLAKASSWYFMIETARQSSWNATTAIGTFSITSTRNPFMQPSGVRALSHVIASLVALGQVINILPKHARARSILWAFSVITLIPLIANDLAIRTSQSSLIESHEHPVAVLIQNAKSEFDVMLQKQSTTYAAAHDEYQRRYGVNPPLGFEAWYEFAKLHQSPIVDEFDTVYTSISPFWRLSGQEFRRLMGNVQHEPGSEVWSCAFSGGSSKTLCDHSIRTFDRNVRRSLDMLLADVGGVLPDVKFLVNHLDEPRVLIPPPPLEIHPHNDHFNLTDLSRQPAWGTLTKFCSSRGSRKSGQITKTAATLGLPFVTDTRSVMDLCQHPEYSGMHGFAMSPTSLRLFEGMAPIFATGSPSTMGDILYPSPAYSEPEFQYDGARDLAWDKKRNNLYWAGSTTGGFALDDKWQHYHRQRFVQLAQNLEKRQHQYLRESDGVVSLVKSSFFNSRLYDVAFTRIFQCKRRYCRDQRAYFNAKSWAGKDDAFQSRLVFDIDGNGISGRYYKLLASTSVPLKQTLLREWHDDRLIPWVHYIPVSQSMEELPELVTYLTSTKAGQKSAREIANQGRDWYSKAFRDVDRTIYVYRLLLEMARLQDPERPAWRVDDDSGV
ncbi:Uu.00g060350.m01.CDS01 [Anthostomella pinea]|uniref:Uu.00g060350.m01.CDS01 n=1 Tax=Anthostomella pinea TaxID=933095 RepID=A0AAI8VLN8_9PEZI|nr:Uu.00g060350.m01.CDS01 [Anthostomella pinea]